MRTVLFLIAVCVSTANASAQVCVDGSCELRRPVRNTLRATAAVIDMVVPPYGICVSTDVAAPRSGGCENCDCGCQANAAQATHATHAAFVRQPIRRTVRGICRLLLCR